MKISPQLRLAGGLVTLLFSVALIGDILGLLPRPQSHIREARKIFGESLAVQLSSAAAANNNALISSTLHTLVNRNDQIVYAELTRESGETLARVGAPNEANGGVLNLSTLDNLIVPIFKGRELWGSVRVHFVPTSDVGLRYLGVPTSSLSFILFLCLASLTTFYFFLRKALKELNPTKAVPERVRAAYDVLAEGVLILNENGQIVLANESFARRVGQSTETLVGKSPNSYAWDLSGDGVQTLPWQIALSSGEHVTGMQLRLKRDGAEVSFTVNAAPILGSASRSRGVLVTFDDVSPLEAKNAELASMLVELNQTHKVIEIKNRELETLATRDAMTGVLNRRSFLEVSGVQYLEAAELQQPFSVLMVDIDHFKRVNDTFGHLTGDQAIVAVSTALNQFFGQDGIVGRYGGEEFVVSMPGSDSRSACVAADGLRVNIESLTQDDALPMDTLTVSIGVAELNADTADLTELLDQADRGLYKAKENGRNQVCLFDPQYVPASKRVRASNQSLSGDNGDELRSDLEKMKKRVRDQAEEIAKRSLYDDLTSLPNRFLLQDRIGQAVKQSERGGKPGAVISISLSGYQKIFEIEGNAAAEQLIRGAAETVQSTLRAGDSVSAIEGQQSLTCSRIAHNELAVLAVDLDDVASASRVVERLTLALEKPIEVGAHRIHSRVYCGVALFPVDSLDAPTLIRNATLARKFAQRRTTTHHSGSAYFSRDIDEHAAKSAQIAADLPAAIANGELTVAYQPKVDANTHQVAGVEALARWTHSTLGPVSPMDFIDIAEHLGVIDQLTDSVLTQVCCDLRANVFGNVRVSVNVSPLELSDPGTAARLLGVLRDHEVPASQIEIEVTESSFIKDGALGRDILLALREEGVLIALDDFGTGFSSLDMLTKIPVDVIKIDRSFVSDLHQLPSKHCIVQAILLMARSLNTRVVAEGVSCDEEYACLKMLGCGEFQGFHFARPMSATDLRAYIDRVGLRPRQQERATSPNNEFLAHTQSDLA
ncbi:MAG: EAL domain-containing protein [Gammaproteobacteria bacterium]